MIRRTRRLYAIRMTIALGLIAAGLPTAIARQVPEIPSNDTRAFPFSFRPDVLPGPPRAMGESPFGQRQPPTDMASPPNGPPRVMGASPFFPQRTWSLHALYAERDSRRHLHPGARARDRRPDVSRSVLPARHPAHSSGLDGPRVGSRRRCASTPGNGSALL